ncbi:MAG: hypothetical protein O9335_03380 [Inhella sp.]|uniref:hypothetical protein n=1 Tax=Inhella sp. TaxID=1921806 RepID=UPI0022C401F4|nr:hypothetical protein [Inhella sp.]MCZ8234179.1 hypothetical protein [Inhella sp.]
MASRLLTLLTWILVGASVVAYGLRAWPGSAPSNAPLAVSHAADIGAPEDAWRRLLGSSVVTTEAPPPTDARYSLLGVAAPRADELQRVQGVALLSVDGAPARAYRVGQWVDPQTQVLAVSARGVDLGRDGVVRAHLPLQAPPAPATGALPGLPGGIVTGSVAPSMAATRMVMPPIPTGPIPGVAPPVMPTPLAEPTSNDGSGRGSDEAGPRRVDANTAR